MILETFNDKTITSKFGSDFIENFGKRNHPLIPILQSLSETHR